ncbi:hypothetical protein ACJX0J_029614, partial [Zea mays]
MFSSLVILLKITKITFPYLFQTHMAHFKNVVVEVDERVPIDLMVDGRDRVFAYIPVYLWLKIEELNKLRIDQFVPGVVILHITGLSTATSPEVAAEDLGSLTSLSTP